MLWGLAALRQLNVADLRRVTGRIAELDIELNAVELRQLQQVSASAGRLVIYKYAKSVTKGHSSALHTGITAALHMSSKALPGAATFNRSNGFIWKILVDLFCCSPAMMSPLHSSLQLCSACACTLFAG